MKTLFNLSLKVARDNRRKIKMADAPPFFHKLILSTNGKSWDSMVAYTLAEQGCLNALKYAISQGCPCNSTVTYAAALNGHLDCLIYAHEIGIPWYESYEDCTSAAARNGHIDCLRYAHKHGCSWSEQTTYRAAKAGHLECLRYAHENGCEWDVNVLHVGDEKCVKYALMHRCGRVRTKECYMCEKIEDLMYRELEEFDGSTGVKERRIERKRKKRYRRYQREEREKRWAIYEKRESNDKYRYRSLYGRYEFI